VGHEVADRPWLSAPGMSNTGGTMMLRCSARTRPSTSRSVSSAITNSSASRIIGRSNQTCVTREVKI
jgi:hypothetical protein